MLVAARSVDPQSLKTISKLSSGLAVPFGQAVAERSVAATELEVIDEIVTVEGTVSQVQVKKRLSLPLASRT